MNIQRHIWNYFNNFTLNKPDKFVKDNSLSRRAPLIDDIKSVQIRHNINQKFNQK